jgi:hypothetical protein
MLFCIALIGLKYKHFAPKSYEIARVETVLTFQLIFFFATHNGMKYILKRYLKKTNRHFLKVSVVETLMYKFDHPAKSFEN